MDWSGRTALVTGAAGHAAGPVIRGLAASGANLAISGRDAAKLEERARALGLGPAVLRVTADLTDPDSVDAMLRVIADRWGGVDILVNYAGGWAGGQPLGEIPLADWDALVDEVLRTAVVINRAVVGPMAERGWGRIVNIAASAAEQPRAMQAAYNVAKAGVVALTASVALDYGARGVVANCLSPSVIATAEEHAARAGGQRTRWVSPEELAALALHLCGEGAAVNGENILLLGHT